MRLLLDIHVLLWSLDGDKRLGPIARSLLADRANDILVSMASLWEIALKTQAGKLDANIQGISDTLGQNGVILLGIAENATLMSEDHWMPSYSVPVVSCSA